MKKKYITPVSEALCLAVEQPLLDYSFHDEEADQWSQKDGFDDDINWDSEDK